MSEFSSKSMQINESLKQTRSMVGQSIIQTDDANLLMKSQINNIDKILGLNDIITIESKKGIKLIKQLQSKRFWDKYLYKIIFMIYIITSLYIISKRVGNLIYKIYDWICWILSFFMSWIPGFNYICGYCSSS